MSAKQPAGPRTRPVCPPLRARARELDDHGDLRVLRARDAFQRGWQAHLLGDRVGALLHLEAAKWGVDGIEERDWPLAMFVLSLYAFTQASVGCEGTATAAAQRAAAHGPRARPLPEHATRDPAAACQSASLGGPPRSGSGSASNDGLWQSPTGCRPLTTGWPTSRTSIGSEQPACPRSVTARNRYRARTDHAPFRRAIRWSHLQVRHLRVGMANVSGRAHPAMPHAAWARRYPPGLLPGSASGMVDHPQRRRWSGAGRRRSDSAPGAGRDSRLTQGSGCLGKAPHWILPPRRVCWR